MAGTRAGKAAMLAVALAATGGLVSSGHHAGAQTPPSPTLSPWTTTTSLPQARSRNGAVYANGYLYLVGGIDASGATINTTYYAPVNANGTVGAWNTTTPLPGNRRTVRPVAYNGYIYFAGGNDGSSFRNEVYFARVNGDGTLGAWTATTPLGVSQTSHSTVAYNGYLYVLGGNTGSSCTSNVRFAPINANGTVGTWSTTSALPSARCGNVEAATVANGYLYAAGGFNNASITAEVAYAQVNTNGTLGAWQTSVNALSTAREYHGIEAMNGYLYALGGQTASAPASAAVEVATLNANGSVGPFTATTALPGARSELATEVANGRLYVLGGGMGSSGGTPQASVWFTEAAPSDPTAPAVALTAPAANATVSGTVELTATASDNVAVFGVQFLLDGTPIGAEDTSAPYSLSWDSAAATNTTHTLAARARDTAGNQTTSSGVPITVNNVTPPPALLAAYALNEGTGATTQDVSPNANTATLTSATWTTNGRYGNGINFNGTTGRIRSNANVALGAAFTYEAWVLNPTNAAYEALVTVGSDRDLYLINGVLTFWSGNADYSFGSLPTGSWQHVALTYDGTALRAYVNGTQSGPTRNATLAPTTAPLQLGAWIGFSSNADYFGGTLDEIRVYRGALSPAEIQTDAATPISGTPPPDSTPPVLSGGQPSGVLPSGTSQTSLELVTSENATCRYGPTPGASYSALPSAFSTTGGTSHATTVTGLADGGAYSYYIRCQDTSGNANGTDYTVSFTIGTPDSTAPAVALTAPAANATVSGTVELTATASDNVAVFGVQFLLDGTPIGAEDTSAPYSLSWDSAAATNTTHTLAARARDTAGNQTTSSGVPITVNNVTPPPALLAAYALNEGTGATTQDVSPNANTATLTSATWTTNGRYGNGINFNGTTGRIRSNANVALGAAFTYEAWVLNPTNAAYEALVTVGSDRDLYLINGVLTFWSGNADYSFGSLPTGSWQHVALTYDGTALRAYVNGTQSGPTRNATLAPTTAPLQLGAWIGYNNDNADYFGGTLDEIRVFAGVRSPAEIAADASAPLG